jgi:hypothetical protein
MPASIVIHTNNITRTMTLADLQNFLRSCEAEDIPEDAVVRVLGDRDRRSAWPRLGRRLTQVRAGRDERLTEEPNEPAQVRRSLGLPMTASSLDVFDAMDQRVEAAEQRGWEEKKAQGQTEAVVVRALLGLNDSASQETVLEFISRLQNQQVDSLIAQKP